MNKKALLFGLIYSACVIAFKLSILLGGYSLSHFGWYYSHALSVFLITPFYFVLLYNVRQKDFNGAMSGRDGLRIALSMFAVAAIITSIYNYIEFEYSGKQLAVDYYHGQQFLDYLKTLPKIKPETYSKIIEEQVSNAVTSSFKATTGKLFGLMFIGISGAVIAAAFMRKKSA